MTAPNGIERRDPVSGLLMLGSTLASAGQHGLSGEIRIADRRHIYALRLIRGLVSAVVWHGRPLDGTGRATIRNQACALFDLPRPLVTFDNAVLADGQLSSVHSDQVVVAGMLRRRDLFDPKPLVTRIPVTTLRLRDEGLMRLKGLWLSDSERMFVKRLRTPTPATLAFWKRGLLPKHAAALVIALNLLDCFEDWPAGDLPRGPFTAAIQRKVAKGASDYEILGLCADATEKEVDKAFRRLSFMLHPDRAVDLPRDEQHRAEKSFRDIAEAHARIKRRRRARRVRHSDDIATEVRVVRSTEPWRPFLEKSQTAAANGNRFEARAYALKALAATPPSEVVVRLKDLIRSVA